MTALIRRTRNPQREPLRRHHHGSALLWRGPKGEIWKIEDAIHPLVKLCVQLLSEDPLFFLINSYTTGLAPSVLSYMMGVEIVPNSAEPSSDEVGLPVSQTDSLSPAELPDAGRSRGTPEKRRKKHISVQARSRSGKYAAVLSSKKPR